MKGRRLRKGGGVKIEFDCGEEKYRGKGGREEEKGRAVGEEGKKREGQLGDYGGEEGRERGYVEKKGFR